MDKRTVKVRVFGKVQGVFFRYHTHLQAQSLDLKGWVKNCSDGSVEAVLSGSEPAIKKMILWLHQGPESAQVTKVDVDDDKHYEDHQLCSFEILY